MTNESTTSFSTSDGVEIAADLHVADSPSAAAVLCHPHPQFGGNRYNPVIDALFAALPAVGISALRFDFRAEFGEGVTEQLDVIGALDHLSAEANAADEAVPLFVVGYSFGAMVALAIRDERIDRRVLIAPPLGALDLGSASPDAGSAYRTLVLTPAHDQFAPPDSAEPIVASWADATFETVLGADHFLVGHARPVAQRAAEWLGRP